MIPAPRLAVAEAMDRARELATRRSRALLGIVGPPGSGKSTLADRVLRAVPDSVLVPMDGFHLAQRVLDASGLAGRKGAPETFDRDGYVALLQRLRRPGATGSTVYAPEFRREIEEPIAGAIAVPPSVPLVVTEGNYLLLWPEVRPLLDEVWWVEVPDDVRLRRLVARHAAFGKSPQHAYAWAHGSDEANARLVAPGRNDADVHVVVEDPVPDPHQGGQLPR